MDVYLGGSVQLCKVTSFIAIHSSTTVRTCFTYAHVGYVHQYSHKHKPCSFSTFFNVSVVTNVTAHDARVTSRMNFQ